MHSFKAGDKVMVRGINYVWHCLYVDLDSCTLSMKGGYYLTCPSSDVGPVTKKMVMRISLDGRVLDRKYDLIVGAEVGDLLIPPTYHCFYVVDAITEADPSEKTYPLQGDCLYKKHKG